MKRIKYLIFVFVFSIVSFGASATEVTTPTETDPTERAQEIENRIQQIWKMDFSKMDKIEKQALKTELKAIKKEIKSTEGLDSKLSISVGAVIIILLIIILVS